MLVKLSALRQIPRANCVVEASSPQLETIVADVDAGGTVSVTLELSHQRLVVQVPHGNVTVGTAAEADLRVGRDGQCIASWCTR